MRDIENSIAASISNKDGKTKRFEIFFNNGIGYIRATYGHSPTILAEVLLLPSLTYNRNLNFHFQQKNLIMLFLDRFQREIRIVLFQICLASV